jgi:hypothetical protein
MCESVNRGGSRDLKMNSGYGAIYWLQSFLVTNCEGVPQIGPYSLGYSDSNSLEILGVGNSSWFTVT